MTFEVATPKCRFESEDGTLLWEAYELAKFWSPVKDDTVVWDGVEYEVKDIVWAFEVQEGFVDPVTSNSHDLLGAIQTITVKLKT